METLDSTINKIKIKRAFINRMGVGTSDFIKDPKLTDEVV